MAEHHDIPDTGHVDEDTLGDVPHNSSDDNQHNDHSSDISPRQSPRDGPVSSVFPHSRGRRNILSGMFEGPEGDLPHQSQVDNSLEPTAQRNYGVDNNEVEAELGDEADSDNEDEPRASRPNQGGTNTCTFDAPTRSSMAKQNEKVDLRPTLKKTPTMNRTLSTSQRSLLPEDHGGRFHFGNALPMDAPRPEYRRTLSGQHDGNIEHPSSLAATARRFGHRGHRSHSFDEYKRPPNTQKRFSLSGVQNLETPTDLHDKGWANLPLDLLIPHRLPVDLRDDTKETRTPKSPTLLPPTSSHDNEEAIAADRPGEHDIEIRGNFDESHVIVSREQLNSLRNQLEFEQSQRRGARNELRAVRIERDNLEQDLQAVQDKYGNLQEHLQAVQDEQNQPIHEAQILLKDLHELRQEHKVLNHKWQGLQQRLGTCHLQTKAPSTLEAALHEIALLRVAGTDVKKAEKDSDNANAETAQMYDDLKNLRDDLMFLDQCVNDKTRIVPEGAKSGQISSKIQRGVFAPVAKEHAASLLRLFDAMDEAVETSETINNQLQGELDAAKSLTKYLDEKRKSTHSESSITFQKLYEGEKKRRETVEADFRAFRDVAAGSKDLELRNENAKLKDGLDKYYRRTIIPRLQSGIYQASARLWQEEVRITKEELSKRTIAFQEDHAAQATEMRLYIENYYNKTKDESHWNLQDLQTKVASLERDLRQTNDLFNKTKIDKARLEDQFAQFLVDNSEKAKFITENLMYGQDLPLPSPVPGLDPDDASSHASNSFSPSFSPSSSPSSSLSSSPSSSTSWLATPDFKKAVPRYPPRFILQLEQYKATMVRFRQDQEKRRLEEDDALDAIMEKLRRYRIGELGVKYPPSKGPGWEVVGKKSSWDRWDGEGWRREGKLTVVEERLIRSLKGKKLLVTDEKARRL